MATKQEGKIYPVVEIELEEAQVQTPYQPLPRQEQQNGLDLEEWKVGDEKKMAVLCFATPNSFASNNQRFVKCKSTMYTWMGIQGCTTCCKMTSAGSKFIRTGGCGCFKFMATGWLYVMMSRRHLK